jgi:hypothetical protein
MLIPRAEFLKLLLLADLGRRDTNNLSGFLSLPIAALFPPKQLSTALGSPVDIHTNRDFSLRLTEKETWPP